MRLTQLLLVASLSIASGCAMVAGHVRPIWDQSWSQVAYATPSRSGETLRVIVRGPDRQLMPGVTVTAKDQLGHETTEITDTDGAASFKLAPGAVMVRTEMSGLATHRRTLDLRADQVCVLEVISGVIVNEIVACCG